MDRLVIGNGGSNSSLTVDVLAFPGFQSDFKPRNDVLATVTVHTISGSGVADTELGLVLLTTSGTISIFYVIPGGDFIAPGVGQNAGWQNSLTFCYTADSV